MCGRFTNQYTWEELHALYSLSDVSSPQSNFQPRYNVAPTDTMPVVRLKDGKRELAVMKWGLVPSSSKDATDGAKMINARAETVAEKPAFRSAFRHRRCLVTADGFYEWQKLAPKVRQPYLVRRQDRLPFAFAGLWSSWRGPEASRLETFTIITTSPNSLLRPLHDRMPVILDRRDFAAWLDPANRDTARLQSLLVPAPDAGWEAVPVSRAVNSPDHDEPDCIEPLLAPIDIL